MNIIYLALGIVIGILVRDIKCKTVSICENIIQKALNPTEEKTQFIDSVSNKELFDSSKTIDDLIENFKKK